MPGPTFLQPYVTSAREECENILNPILGNYPQQIQTQIQSVIKFSKGTF